MLLLFLFKIQVSNVVQIYNKILSKTKQVKWTGLIARTRAFIP